MALVVTAQQMRRAEERVFIAQPGVDLMGRAARAVADAVTDLEPAGPVLVAVGPGNNGGDGLFAAALLAPARPVHFWLAAGSAHDGGLAAARAVGAMEVDLDRARQLLADSPVVLDAVLGIGGRPGLDAAVAEFAKACEAAGVPVVAVDLPSGLDADSGELADTDPPSFLATVSLTFAALKPCHVTAPASRRCGRVVVADIGVPVTGTE